jgi:hypothetical protein
MPGYDQTFEPPEWWVEALEQAVADLGISNTRLAADASAVVSRTPPWGADRISKLRSSRGTQHTTIELITAVSRVLKLPVPFVVFSSEREAVAVDRYIDDFRRRQSGANPERDARRATVLQALDGVRKDAEDQMPPVASAHEGSPRGPRTRRAPRGGT